MRKTILMTASAMLALAVGFCAFSAHALKSQISAEMMQVFKTGVEYHFYHALGLLFIGIIPDFLTSRFLNWSAILITAGIILFSGSLYILAITGIKWLGAITPLGGIGFILGWTLLFVAVLKKKEKI